MVNPDFSLYEMIYLTLDYIVTLAVGKTKNGTLLS